MSEALATSSATRLAEAIRSKQVSSRELLDLYLDRIERLGPPINAVVTLDVERARGAADAADAQLARGDEVGPLHGLPVTIKDAIETEGIRSTGGAIELTDHVPAVDAPAVARLKRAGAVVFGKTNLPRWSGDMQSYNEMFGTTNNPWSLERVPGGSSGGAAAAVACGFTSFELGTDIGGSVRIPAHFCGVCSLKPSYGVVPQRGYLDHVGGGTIDPDINVFGPIARDPDDLELLLGVLAGPEPEREIAWRLDLPTAHGQALSDYRIGVWFDDPACRVLGEYVGLLRSVADRIADAGAKVADAHPAIDMPEQIGVFGRLIVAAIAQSLPAEFAEAAAGTHLAWLNAQDHRAQLRERWAEWFDEYDVLLCPVVPTVAFPHDQSADIMARSIDIDGVARGHLELTGWTGLIGVVGLPSAVVPIGRTAEGLPVGMQIVSPYLHDRRSVRVAQLVRDVIGGYEPPPGFAPRPT
jgi:amidase